MPIKSSSNCNGQILFGTDDSARNSHFGKKINQDSSSKSQPILFLVWGLPDLPK
jgi:hypothetical protein